MINYQAFYYIKINKYMILLTFLILFVTGCAKVDPVTGEKIIIEPSADNRAAEYRDKGGGLFGDINKIGNGKHQEENKTSNKDKFVGNFNL